MGNDRGWQDAVQGKQTWSDPVEVLAVIPARSGSKSIPDKNVRLLAGKPLLAHSIEHGLQAKLVNRVLVSTDSAEYARIAREYGADAPFSRPVELAGDLSTDLEVFVHALVWLAKHEGYHPDICVHLRPTSPVRQPAMIDQIVQLLLDQPELDSVRTVTEVLHPPFKMWYRGENGILSPVAAVPGLVEPWNEPRQKLPKTYIQTANIDAVRTRVISEQHSMTGRRIYGFIEEQMLDIDTEGELRKAASVLGGEKNGTAPPSHQTGAPLKTFCFDIDGVIATLTPNNDYRQAQPQAETIALINRLYDGGHQIILFTARGNLTGIDWADATAEQMERWGVKYHRLLFGKPAADYYIDDRFVSLADVAAMLRD